MNDAIRHLPGTPATTLLACRNLLIICPAGEPDGADVQAVRSQCDAMAKQWRSGFGVMVCIPAGIKPPSQQARRLITEMLNSIVPHTRALAWVVLGQGFIAAAVRSAIAIILPAKVFNDIGTAVDWMIGQLRDAEGERLDKLAIVQRVESVVGGRSQSSPSLA